MISAPIVNQRRFLRSVACENFDRLMPEAIESAADAISVIVQKNLGGNKSGGKRLTAPPLI